MTTLAQASAPTAPHPGLWTRLKAHIARVKTAHARQARITPQAQEISRDIGIPVEVLLGHSTYDPTLPFFMHQAFDRRD